MGEPAQQRVIERSMIDDFTAKLGHALKAAELSRSRLAKLAGVDKSVASRWVSA